MASASLSSAGLNPRVAHTTAVISAGFEADGAAGDQAVIAANGPAGGGTQIEGKNGAWVFVCLGHADLLFGLVSEARGLAGEGCGLAPCANTDTA